MLKGHSISEFDIWNLSVEMLPAYIPFRHRPNLTVVKCAGCRTAPSE